MLADTLHVCQQQPKLCTVASNTPDRYDDIGGATPTNCRSFPCREFVLHKSDIDISAVAIDKAHEEANAVIKGDGGVAGITEDPPALRRWMVAGPAVS